MLVKEYAKLIGVSTVSVTKRLKANNPPKSIKSWRKFGNTYDIEINQTELNNLIYKNISQNGSQC